MWDFETLTLLGPVVVAAPVLLFASLGLPCLLDWKLSERAITRACQAATFAGLLAALTILGWMLATDRRHVAVRLGTWVVVPHYHFAVTFVLSSIGTFRPPVVRAVRHHWGICQPLPAPRARV
jgi:hypothetical protein